MSLVAIHDGQGEHVIVLAIPCCVSSMYIPAEWLRTECQHPLWNVCLRWLLVALGIGWPSQRFQNRDAPAISSALRLLIRAQNRIMKVLATVAAEMRG